MYGRGHETGQRREGYDHAAWYQEIALEHIRRIEEEEEADFERSYPYPTIQQRIEEEIEEEERRDEVSRQLHTTLGENQTSTCKGDSMTVSDTTPVVNDAAILHLALPDLPEAPCSVNTFIDVDGYGRTQVTGRGWNAEEAAANLRDTICATRKALAPAPPTVGALLECALRKALARGDEKLAARATSAAMLVLAGKVAPHTAVVDHYSVTGSQPEPYVVNLDDPDAPGGHSLSLIHI